MESTRADPRIGLVLNGRYRITAPIGEGGMGLVYRGERLQLRRPVAIKFLQTPFADRANFVARFEREARAMSMLSHPYCVSVLDFGVHESPYIIMDFVTGFTLREVMDGERLSPQRALHITRQVLIGLAHAHGQGVVHRDIKPGNIMLGEATGLSDHVRIFDFGLAKLHDPELHGEASIAAIVGTPAYMAPEQARAEKVDGRADLYAAGVVLFEMLTGQKPFEADNAYQLLSLQRDKTAPRLRERAPALSVELDAVVGKALEKDPNARFQTAAEFGAALEATPEWAGVGGALVHTTGPQAALADTQIATSEGREALVKERARAPRARTHGRSRAWAALALLLVGALGYARWKLDLDPSALLSKRATPAHATEGKGAKPARSAAAPPTVSAEPAAVTDAPAAEATEPAADEAPAAQAVRVFEAAVEALSHKAAELGAGASPSADTQPGETVTEESEELSEAALAAADEALNDEEEREVVLAATPSPKTKAVESIADVRKLMARGDTDAAIRGIQQLRRKRPRDAQLPFLLGNLYFDKGWSVDGLAKYRETIRLSSGYRKNARIQRDAIRALEQERTYARARALLVRDIGKAALPALRRAARAHASLLLRRRATSIAKQIAR